MNTQRVSLWLTAALPFVCAAGMPMLPAVVALGYPLLQLVLPPRPVIAGIAVVFIVAAACSAIGVAIRWRQARHDAGLVAALLALIASYAAASFAGIAPATGLKEAAAAVIACVAVLSCSEIAAVDRLRSAWLATYLAAGTIALGYAIALVIRPPSVEAYVYMHGRAYGTFLQPNEVAAYTLFLLPIAIALVVGSKSFGPTLRMLGIVSAAVGALALAMSGARAGWIGALFGLAAFAVALGRRAVAGVVATVLLVGVIAALWTSARHDPSENALRVGVWQGAARVVERFAITGTGPGNFADAYERVRPPASESGVLHAHDLALNVLAENGALGFGVALWLVAASIVAVRRARAGMPADPQRIALYAAFVAGFVASALQSIVHVTMFVALWAPMLGMLLGVERASAQSP